jgi:hypothetical protein
MAMVRKNPLPAGRYWIFIQKASQDIFDLWLKKNSDVITIEKKETYGDLGVPLLIKPNESFYVFLVSEPTIWPRGVGFPNTADATVKQSGDVKKRGPVPTATDVITDIQETASEAANNVLIAVVIIGGILLFAKTHR